MRLIKPLTVDDPEYHPVMRQARVIWEAVNKGKINHLTIAEQEIVLLAYVTWRKIAEERQTYLDHYNEGE